MPTLFLKCYAVNCPVLWLKRIAQKKNTMFFPAEIYLPEPREAGNEPEPVCTAHARYSVQCHIPRHRLSIGSTRPTE